MIGALGHCEDPACLQSTSSSHSLHLNAHNVYYEEAKKKNNSLISELENHLALYQAIFEQQIQSYRQLVHQASTLLLHNTSTIVPIDQIRPVLEQIQQAIAFYQQEKVVIKCEPALAIRDPNMMNNPSEPPQKVVVRLQRIDCIKQNRSPTDSKKNDKTSMVKRLQK